MESKFLKPPTADDKFPFQFIFDLQRFAVTSSLSDDGTLTISGDGAIADNAFMNNTNIKKVVIGEGVTSIAASLRSKIVA